MIESKVTSTEIFLLVLVFIVCGLCHPPAGIAQQGPKIRIIDAEGAGVVINNDTALARDNAINNALRKAVEQAVDMFVSSETMVESYQIINDGIYSRANSYIQNYRIISGDPDENVYMVKIKATVSMESVRRDLQSLGIIVARDEMPKKVAVTVRGIKSCYDFVRFRDALRTEVRGIKNVFPRWMESGTVGLDLDIHGNAQSLADELTARDFSGFSFYITDIGQNSIELSLSK